MPQDVPTRADESRLEAARPSTPGGVVRRLGHGLVQARLFGAPPPTLGRFVVERKLGEGGMGAVFQATDPTLGRTVALKVLRDPARASAQVDIAHEARMLARLSHPNVVTVHELGVEDGERYVCMAFVDGPHLGAWLDSRADLTWRTVVEQLLGAARGLGAAHRAGVIHRDFKLENVLVGSDGVPQVTDFGLARTDSAPGDGPPLPQDAAPGRVSALAGTPGYVAPELFGGAPATERSDQYSFCVALALALDRVRGPVPEGLRDVVARGTARDPDARFPDLRALEAALEAVLGRRGNPDQRARDVLAERLQHLWIEPVRGRVLGAGVAHLPIRCEAARDLGESSIDVGEGDGARLARALHDLRAAFVLVGAPGAGKTLRLLGVAEALLRLGRTEDGVTLPVVLNLSSFATFRGTLATWLVHELVAKYALPRPQVERWLDECQLALLLDGLDEVSGAERVRCVEALDALRATHPLPVLVACREENFRALPRRPRSDAVLRLRPLDDADVDAALGALGPSLADDPALREQLRNPLLLALFAELASDLRRPAPAAGELRERLYAASFAHALDLPPRLDGDARAREEAAVRWLATTSERAGTTEIWLEELQHAWLPTAGQRALAAGLGVGAAFALSMAANLAASRVAGLPVASGVFFGLLAAGAAFVIQGGVRATPMEAMRWSWPRVRTWIPRNLALGVATGVLHGLFFDFWADLMLGTATGLLGLSVIGLVPEGRERRADPGDGLWESLRNSVLVAPIVGVVIGVPVGYVVLPLAQPLASPTSMYHTHPDPGFAWAVTMGTSATITSLYITGFLAPLFHVATRVTLAITSPVPLRLPRWLGGLVERGLLQRVGGGWQFRHPTFRAWLAAGSAPRP